ncbi:transporter [Gordonia sp. TBRC 11910]|uniref:Transporter n=1 Tax=Gordonia asplenii TaxID=2725283 RepID=A0A848KW78_9ACTN|nr:transporter [Gordonia asplenii]NMO00431.1 transporter [Gordonia asplenii]
MNEVFYNIIIVIGVLALWLLLISLVIKGWRNRGRRQLDLVGDFPVAPEELGEVLIGPDSGLYVGSTLAPSWQDRIAVGDYGDRATTDLVGFASGILFVRKGASEIWIPRESLTAVRTERGLAGKVMTADGLLVFRWILPSGTEIDSGIRADDKAVYAEWIAEYAPAQPSADATADAADAPHSDIDASSTQGTDK